MKYKTITVAGLLSALLLSACGQNQQTTVEQAEQIVPAEQVNAANIKAHIEFLADDLLQGRNTGSKEYEIAAKYVASHFNQYGLNPAGDNNSWFQSVPFIESSIDNNLAEMLLNIGDKETYEKTNEAYRKK